MPELPEVETIRQDVYGREGKKCLKCHGTIKKIKLAGRGTSYCPACQK